MWVKNGKNMWVSDKDNVCIVKDTIIGYLRFKSYKYFISGGLDYTSFKTIREAKKGEK